MCFGGHGKDQGMDKGGLKVRTRGIPMYGYWKDQAWARKRPRYEQDKAQGTY